MSFAYTLEVLVILALCGAAYAGVALIVHLVDRAAAVLMGEQQ